MNKYQNGYELSNFMHTYEMYIEMLSLLDRTINSTRMKFMVICIEANPVGFPKSCQVLYIIYEFMIFKNLKQIKGRIFKGNEGI